MDVVLGVAVADRVARLALVGSGAASGDVVDQSVVDLSDNPIGKLTETVIGTNRLLADGNHRLVATRLCWSDHPKADLLRRALEDSGVQNVAVLSESEATTALSGTGRPASSMRAESPDDPTLALARGAAMAAGAAADATAMAPAVGLTGDATAMAPAVGPAGDATAMAPAVGPAGDATAMAPATQLAGDATAIAPTAGMAESHAEEPQLAYSMAGDDELLPVDDDFYDDEAETGRQRLSGRSLLISNAVIAFAVIGFASLAVAVAITVRPTAASEPVVGLQNAAPGKFMPLLPTQQQAPVPPPPPDQPNAGYQGGTIADSNGYIPAPSLSPGAGGTPVPAAPVPASPGTPGVPGFMPNPNGPIPVPIIIPFPGWRPPWPPYQPPTTTTPITTTPITTTPPTSTQPHVTTTPPTSTQPHVTTTQPTSTQPHVTTTPPTSKAPHTSTQTPTTAAPAPSTPHTTVPPHTQTQTQQTVAPKPVPPQTTQKPVFPQLPHGGH
jgi:hypothetical protein